MAQDTSIVLSFARLVGKKVEADFDMIEGSAPVLAAFIHGCACVENYRTLYKQAIAPKDPDYKAPFKLRESPQPMARGLLAVPWPPGDQPCQSLR